MARLLALLPVLIAFQAGAPPALAWTWPADGPVLRPFTLGDDPYAGGQHRGLDVAAATGTPVRAPAAGVVTFAGTVPGGGRSVTVRTADGYSVTLVHLGSIAVERDDLLAEGATVGTIGPSGDPEHGEPSVHLGIRLTPDPHGYLDPLAFLPSRETAPAPPPAPPAEVVPSSPPVPATPPQASPVPVVAPFAAPALGAPRDVPRASADTEPSGAVVSARPTDGASETPAPTSSSRSVAASPNQQSPLVPPRRLLRSYEVPSLPAAAPLALLEAETPPTSADEGSSPQGARTPAIVAMLVGAMLAAGALGLGVLRQLVHARLAHAPAPVLDQRPRRAAEDTRAPRAAQEDGLVLDRDLERVSLEQPEALPDLDRNHDSAELIQVANDACRRSRAATAPLRFHQIRPRVPSRCGRAETISAR